MTLPARGAALRDAARLCLVLFVLGVMLSALSGPPGARAGEAAAPAPQPGAEAAPPEEEEDPPPPENPEVSEAGAAAAGHGAQPTSPAMEPLVTDANLPEFLKPLDRPFLFGVKLWQVALAIVVAVLALAANALIRYGLEHYAARRDDEEEGAKRSFRALLARSLVLPVRIAVWAVALRILIPILAPDWTGGAVWFSELLLSLAVASFLYCFADVIDHYLRRYADRTETRMDDMIVPVARKGIRAVVILIAGIHVYQSASGQSVTTLIAGLGLGGLAFALAAQDTLKNFFGCIMILSDQPFVVGDRIDFNGHDGVVERVGFRSVRLRRLDGHLVTIPNARAADDVIHNIGRRPHIRRIMNVTITYDTPLEKVERAVEILRDILADHEGMDPEFPPRVYFNELNADSLNILAIYWYHPPAYWDYLDHCQRVNLELMRRYEAEGIEFAFPTQTLYLAGDPARKLTLHHEGGLPGLEGSREPLPGGTG